MHLNKRVTQLVYLMFRSECGVILHNITVTDLIFTTK